MSKFIFTFIFLSFAALSNAAIDSTTSPMDEITEDEVKTMREVLSNLEIIDSVFRKYDCSLRANVCEVTTQKAAQTLHNQVLKCEKTKRKINLVKKYFDQLQKYDPEEAFILLSNCVGFKPMLEAHLSVANDILQRDISGGMTKSGIRLTCNSDVDYVTCTRRIGGVLSLMRIEPAIEVKLKSRSVSHIRIEPAESLDLVAQGHILQVYRSSYDNDAQFFMVELMDALGEL